MSIQKKKKNLTAINGSRSNSLMNNYYDEFDSLKGKNDIKFSNNIITNIFKSFPSFFVTKENNIFHAVNQIVNTLKLIVIDECDISNDKYLIICFCGFIFTIQETDLYLIKQYFNQNKDSSIFILKREENTIIHHKMEEIGLNLKDYQISFLDEYFQRDISDFLSSFHIKQYLKYWELIKNSFSAFLIKEGQFKSKIDRVKKSKELFQSNSNDKITLRTAEYIPLENVGIGTYSLIKKIYHAKNQRIYVLKINQDEEKLIEREHSNYLSVHHPFILKYYGVTMIDLHKTLILEYADGKELNEIKDLKLNINEKLKIIFEIMIIIQYLHYNNFIYRDLKPNNLIIDDKRVVILIDLDRMIKNNDFNNDENSTRDFSSAYIAPEVNNENYSFSADIYSLGMIIYFIVFEKTPIRSNLDFNFPKEFSKLQDIFVQCIDKNPDKRPNIFQLINDFYINCFSNFHSELIENDIVQTITHNNITNYFQYLIFLSNCDDSYSLYKLGKLYKEGKILSKNTEKMIHYYILSADLGYSKSQYFVGVFYYEGEYIERNIEKSIQYLLLSAEQNYVNAYYYLGTAYYENKYIERDINKAVKYFRLASKNHHLLAKYCLGIIYYEGKYIKRDIDLSIQYFEYCANNNHSESQYNLGMIYYEGEYVSQNISKALYYLNLAAEQNNLNALYNLGVIYHEGKYVEHDDHKAFDYLKLSAQYNHPLSLFYIGKIFLEMNNSQNEIEVAIHFFKLAADQNHLRSQFLLGAIYYNGVYVKRNMKQSIKYYLLAANQNYPDALNELGAIYSEGKFIKQDINKSIEYFSKASDLDYSISQYNLGLIYWNGIYVDKDINKGIYYFTLAAKHGHLQALYRLGYIYYCVKKDINKSIHYFELAANQNHYAALNNLGIIYYDNKYIPRDVNKSIYYFSLADKLNYAESQYSLGIIYYSGKHIIRDIKKAIYYYSRAAEQNHSDAQNDLGAIYLDGKYTKQCIDKAIQYFLYASKSNNCRALYNLGVIYYEGKYVQRNIAKSIQYLSLSANLNYSNALYLLGMIYYDNKFVKCDINKAIQYLTKAAFQNNKYAQYILGMIYFDGIHIQRNINKTINYLSQSATNYNSEAALQLGCLYHQGKYIDKDIEKAIHFYKESSSFNNQFAKNNLGVIYKNDIEFKNISLAVEYFNEAIKQKNDFLSMFNLSNIYLDENNLEKSVDLLIKSSLKEFLPSQILLCYLITENLDSINLKSIENKLQNLNHKLKIFASKILNWYEKIQPYLLMISLIEYFKYFHSIDLLFINGRIISSDKLYDDEPIDDFMNSKLLNINKSFYEGFGEDLN